MNMEVTPQLLISLCAMVVALLGYLRNGRKDDDAVREGLIKANIKLDQVCATTTETRTDIKSQAQQIYSLQTEIEVLKRDLKTAFSKIDEIERREAHE